MLTIGIWVIVVILLVVHWEKIQPFLSGAIRALFVLALLGVGIGLIWGGGSWAWDHWSTVKEWVLIAAIAGMCLYYGILFILSTAHVYSVTRLIEWREVYKVAFDGWVLKVIFLSLMMFSVLLFLPSESKENGLIIGLVWCVFLVFLSLYGHLKLCRKFNPTCKVLPYLEKSS